jgi:alpha-ketoglutarate-dependent taurine dioxygenase
VNQLGAVTDDHVSIEKRALDDPDLVRIGSADGSRAIALVIEPATAGIGLVAWTRTHRAWLADQLLRHGAILFRGFDVAESTFEPFIAATSSGALPYTERSSPRTRVIGNVYTSTDYPARFPIFPHNEQSYNLSFPLKIYFMCVLPAQQQGGTPLCDCRRVFRRLDPSLRRRFAEKRYMYVRNFGGGLGLDWRDVFQTDVRSEVESYCRVNRIAYEWRGEDELRTRQVRNVMATHPQSGESSWFNHLTFFHVSSLPQAVRDALLATTDEDELPNNTYYGDGLRIEDSVMEELRGLYESESICIPWEHNDVLMVDNLLVAHGREPFVGPRRVIAGMAAPYDWAKVQIPAP